MKYVSICIPTHEMGGKGPQYLAQSFDVMLKQTFQDFEVVISDQSSDGGVKKVCEEYLGRLDITYLKEPSGIRGQSVNFNNGLKHCTGKLVKILWMDDFFYHENALKDIVDAFDLEKDHWLATPCTHTIDCKTFFRSSSPKYVDATALMKNGLGAPSVLTIKNDHPFYFDEGITVWFTDLDYYKRYYDAYGLPKILDSVNIVIRIHDDSVTNTTATIRRRDREWQYIVKKYRLSHPWLRILEYRRKLYVRMIKGRIKNMLGMKQS